ncbi:hypothetical protein [Microbulbifer variabilis]|uniref:hypothetical protein n=1 Tax=Microbulbifer variabilis TaxID=266805 RepID=UPI00299E94B6|nr:hypothetical protein [Microbulbifer variabilis]
MINVSLQDQGYGSEAVKHVLAEIKHLEGFNSISIFYVEGHGIMKSFFEHFGFEVVVQQ